MQSGHMPPQLALANLGNRDDCNFVDCGHLSVGVKLFSHAQTANLPNRLFCESCAAIFFPFWIFPSSFIHGVVDIVRLCSQKKVFRIDTGHVVAPVQNANASRHIPPKHRVGNNMRSRIPTSSAKLAVASLIAKTTHPNPTVIFTVSGRDAANETRQRVSSQFRFFKSSGIHLKSILGYAVIVKAEYA